MPWPRHLVASILLVASPSSAGEQPATVDGFALVEAATKELLATQRGYRTGDLISRKQVAQLLDRLAQAGVWRLPEADRTRIAGQCLDEKSFLFEQLNSPKGKILLRDCSRLQGVHDLLDRLSQLPQGRDLIEKLVRGPDGYKMLEYLMASRGGAELERMLEQAPKGRDVRKPTGRIYGETALLAELHNVYESRRRTTDAKGAKPSAASSR